MTNILATYFPELDENQIHRFKLLEEVFRSVNERINLVSRKDMDQFSERHMLYSLAIAKVVGFPTGATVLDVGTGGGLPGLPLAIMFPEVKFHLVDSIQKKIRAVKEMAEVIGLTNVTAEACRIETHHTVYDYVVSRAVTALPGFYAWVNRNVDWNKELDPLPGILYLKGGDFDEELKRLPRNKSVVDVSGFFSEPFFETKKVIYLTR